MYVMMTANVGIIILNLLLLDLESWMVNFLLTTHVSQSCQYNSLHVFFGEYVSYHDGFSWFQVPNMDIMHVNYSNDGLEVLPKQVKVNMRWSWLHNEVITILNYRNGG